MSEEVSVIPVEQVPDQTFFVDIDGKGCEIHLYLRYAYMFMDLKVEDNVLFEGIICLDRTNILQYTNSYLDGKLMFVDTQGSEDPYYSEFGERFALVYVQ